MARINFQNLPSTSTPLNATNLNTIQNIEINTWTPTFDGANVTFQQRYAYYAKVDKLVFVWFKLSGTIDNVTGNPAYAFISGLPYSAFLETAGSLFEHLNVVQDNDDKVLLRVTGNKLCLQSDNAAGTGASEWYSHGTDTFYLSGFACYFTNE